MLFFSVDLEKKNASWFPQKYEATQQFLTLIIIILIKNVS